MRFLFALALMINLAFAADVTQEKAANQNKSSQAQQQKINQPPIIVNVVQPLKTDEEKKEDREERNRKSSIDNNIEKYTGQLASYTFWLFAATLVLAIGTLGLWWFARKQSIDIKRSTEATMLMAKASVAAQIPVVAWHGFKLVKCDKDGIVLDDPVHGGPIPEYCRPVLTIINTGPTKIQAMFYAIKWEVAKDVSKEPHFGGMWPNNVVITENTQHSFTTKELIVLSQEERKRIENGERLWVYGFVIYKDFLNDGHRMGNIAKWDNTRAFVQVQRENYSYHESERKYT